MARIRTRECIDNSRMGTDFLNALAGCEIIEEEGLVCGDGVEDGGD